MQSGKADHQQMWQRLSLIMILSLLTARCEAGPTQTVPATQIVMPPTQTGEISAPTLTTSTPTSCTSPTTPAPTPVETQVEELLARMTLEEKVGQLFAVQFDGTEFSPWLEQAIGQLHVGGIILFDDNVENPEQVAMLINRAQEVATVSGARIPLFVAVDQEGWPIVRLREGFTIFPGNMALGSTASVEHARLAAIITGRELEAVGINMNLAPVLDVNSNPANPVIGIRSFGADPALVSELGTAAIAGYQAAGVVAVGKHFPGHGDTSLDSHLALPSVWHDRAHLDTVELVPFRAAAAELDVIMTAHVTFPAIDPTPSLPATLSAPTLQGLLRSEMGFDGLIATDSLGMDAIDQAYGVANASALAFQAGADLLMFGNDPGHSPEEAHVAYEGILALVQSGEVPLERVDESVRRILEVKAQYGLLAWTPVNPTAAADRTGTQEHRAAALQIALQAVTLVRDKANVLPFQANSTLLVVSPYGVEGLGTVLGEYAGAIEEIVVHLDPTAEEIAVISARTQEVDTVVLGTLGASWHPAQAQLVASLLDQPLVVVALRSPYDLLMFPAAPTYLATYGESPASLDALARVLFGQVLPQGHLPVPLEGLYPIGHGLENFSGAASGER